MTILLGKYCRLPISDQWLFWRMAILLPFIEMSLHSFGFKKTVRLLQKFSRRRKGKQTDTVRQIIRHRQILQRICRYMPYTGRCLSQSLVLGVFLSHQGIHTTLQFGQQVKPYFKAHAWLEYDGQPVNEGKKIREQYQVFGQSMITKTFS